MKVADISWVAMALLQVEQPERESFRPREVLARAIAEFSAEAKRPGVQHHIQHHAVGNKPANPARLCFLYATEDGGRRLFRAGDEPHPSREGGWMSPGREDVPPEYQHLLDWYDAGYGTTELDRLRHAVEATLSELLPGGRTSSQEGASAGSEFSERLALRLGKEFVEESARLIVSSAAREGTTRHRQQIGDHRDWMVDSFIVDQRSSAVALPVLACESEILSDHGFEATSAETLDYSAMGWVQEFLKLLHFRAPHLLFVARLGPDRRAGGTSRTNSTSVEALLARGARDYRNLLDGVHLYVVILPGDRREQTRIRLGAGLDGELEFEPLAEEGVP